MAETTSDETGIPGAVEDPSHIAFATPKVFTVPELLENVLIQLANIDAKSVFALQRVSTLFNDTISTSITIRRSLCLEPPSITEHKEALAHGGLKVNSLCSDPRIGPVLWKALVEVWGPWPEVDERTKCFWVNVDCPWSIANDPRALGDNGSWRDTVFTRAARNHTVKIMLSDVEWGGFASYTPQVWTHITLGEIVDSYAKVLQLEEAWEGEADYRTKGSI